jgi:hypothetical protein
MFYAENAVPYGHRAPKFDFAGCCQGHHRMLRRSVERLILNSV